jgi:hypothetical protein
MLNFPDLILLFFKIQDFMLLLTQQKLSQYFSAKAEVVLLSQAPTVTHHFQNIVRQQLLKVAILTHK